MSLPTVIAECAFTTDPGAASPSWTAISSYLLADGIETSRGRQRELDVIQAGTARLRVDNRDRRFDPTYTSSPYSPNVVPMRRMRIRATYSAVTYNLFSGYVERWPQTWQGPSLASVPIDLVDGFEPLAISLISSTPATLTTQGLVFTGKSQKDGNAISIEFRSLTDLNRGPSIDVVQTAIRFWIRLDGSGNRDSTVYEAMQALLGDSRVTELVTIALADGSSGGAMIVDAPPLYLSGATYLEELSGARVNRVLDDISWPAADRAVDAGQSRVAATTYVDQQALGHMQDVATTEPGVFFIDGAGRAVFHDRHHRIQLSRLTSLATFGDGSGELPYIDMTPEYTKEQISNDIRISRPDGETQTATDSASITRYFRRVDARSTLLTTDLDASNQAAALLRRYKDPHLRITQIQIKPQLDPAALWPQALGREIGDRVTVKRRPPGGAAVMTQESYIEAIRHRASGGTWTTEFDLSAVETYKPWILGDTTYGVLGSTTIPAF